MEQRELEHRLLAHLRDVAGQPRLAYATPPQAIGGGFSGARIYGFELASPPPQLAGPLVLRVLTGEHTAPRQQREAALQDAAGRLGCAVPRIRLKGPDSAGLGGAFFIMDRLAGGTLLRWWLWPIGLGAVAALSVAQLWPALAGYLAGSTLVGATMAAHQRRLHRLELEDIDEVFAEHGIAHADVDVAYWRQNTADTIAQGDLQGYLPGLSWLLDNAPARGRPTLCHGDIQPLNFMVGWTRVSGMLDWEVACIAEPELDVAVVRCDLILLPGPLLGALFAPIYAAYRSFLRIGGRFDATRLRYYEALRTLFMLANATAHYVQMQRLEAEGEQDIPGPRLPAFFMRMLVRAHVRRFRRLTGVVLEPPAAALS